MKLPDFQIRKRFDSLVQGLVDAAVKRHLPDRETLIIDAVKSIDRKDLAWHVDSPEFRKNVAQFVKEDVAPDVAAEIDMSDLAEKVARHIDAEDVASYVDVDADTIAEKVAEDLDASDVARELDYDKLAEALVEKLKEAWA